MDDFSTLDHTFRKMMMNINVDNQLFYWSLLHKISVLIKRNLYLCFESYSQIGDSVNYQFSSDIYDAIRKDSAYWKGGGISGELSFIGLYKQALTEYDKPRKAEIPVPLSATDSLNFIIEYHPAADS